MVLSKSDLLLACGSLTFYYTIRGRVHTSGIYINCFGSVFRSLGRYRKFLFWARWYCRSSVCDGNVVFAGA